MGEKKKTTMKIFETMDKSVNAVLSISLFFVSLTNLQRYIELRKGTIRVRILQTTHLRSFLLHQFFSSSSFLFFSFSSVLSLTDLQRWNELRQRHDQEVKIEKVAKLLIEHLRQKRENGIFLIAHSVG